MMPQPEDVWGMPPDLLGTLPGYDLDIEKNRTRSREIMQTLGYGPENRLKTKLSARNVPPDRDWAVILTDHLKEITSTQSWSRSKWRIGFRWSPEVATPSA
jgi:peptide/nickel transport system substrate-binding protein